jgi:hypothetical protein
MRPIISLLFVAFILSSCSSNKLEGTFIYTEVRNEKKNDESIVGWGVELGKKIACSNIGVITFRNGKCYYAVNFFGVKQEMKVDYHIDNGVIYINSDMFNSGGVGLFELVDSNTITYQGCIFKRVDLSKCQKGKTISTVNLRTGPGTNHDILKSLDQDTEIFLIERQGDWVKVRANWAEGYIHQDFIEAE